MDLTRETAERAMTAFAVVACGGNSRAEAEPFVRQFLTACTGQMPRRSEMATKTITKVDASKENANKALKLLTEHGNRTLLAAEHAELVAFVTAAASRLPTQKAIDKDRQRKKHYHETRRKPRGKAAAASGTETFRAGPHDGNATEAPRDLPDLKLDVDQPVGAGA